MKLRRKKEGKSSIGTRTKIFLIQVLKVLCIILVIYVISTLTALVIIPTCIAYLGGAVGVKDSMDWRIIASAWVCPSLFITAVISVGVIWFLKFIILFINKNFNKLINHLEKR